MMLEWLLMLNQITTRNWYSNEKYMIYIYITCMYTNAIHQTNWVSRVPSGVISTSKSLWVKRYKRYHQTSSSALLNCLSCWCGFPTALKFARKEHMEKTHVSSERKGLKCHSTMSKPVIWSQRPFWNLGINIGQHPHDIPSFKLLLYRGVGSQHRPGQQPWEATDEVNPCDQVCFLDAPLDPPSPYQ